MRFTVLVALLAISCNPDAPTPLDSATTDDSVPPDDSTDPDDSGPLPCNDDVTWEFWGHGFFLTWCTSCHSADVVGKKRQDAPKGVDFDTYEQVVKRANDIKYRAATIPLMSPKPDPKLVKYIMPPVGGPGDDEREALALWIDCGLKEK
jgi:hypothetical protein